MVQRDIVPVHSWNSFLNEEGSILPDPLLGWMTRYNSEMKVYQHAFWLFHFLPEFTGDDVAALSLSLSLVACIYQSIIQILLHTLTSPSFLKKRNKKERKCDWSCSWGIVEERFIVDSWESRARVTFAINTAHFHTIRLLKIPGTRCKSYNANVLILMRMNGNYKIPFPFEGRYSLHVSPNSTLNLSTKQSFDKACV